MRSSKKNIGDDSAEYLERVGDHAQNIAEWVEYALTGRYKGEVLG